MKSQKCLGITLSIWKNIWIPGLKSGTIISIVLWSLALPLVNFGLIQRNSNLILEFSLWWGLLLPVQCSTIGAKSEWVQGQCGLENPRRLIRGESYRSNWLLHGTWVCLGAFHANVGNRESTNGEPRADCACSAGLFKCFPPPKSEALLLLSIAGSLWLLRGKYQLWLNIGFPAANWAHLEEQPGWWIPKEASKTKSDSPNP